MDLQLWSLCLYPAATLPWLCSSFHPPRGSCPSDREQFLCVWFPNFPLLSSSKANMLGFKFSHLSFPAPNLVWISYPKIWIQCVYFLWKQKSANLSASVTYNCSALNYNFGFKFEKVHFSTKTLMWKWTRVGSNWYPPYFSLIEEMYKKIQSQGKVPLCLSLVFGRHCRMSYSCWCWGPELMSLNLDWLALRFYPKHFLITILSLQWFSRSFSMALSPAPGWESHTEADTAHAQSPLVSTSVLMNPMKVV